MADFAGKFDRAQSPNELFVKRAWVHGLFVQVLILSFLVVDCLSVASAEGWIIPNAPVASFGVLPTFTIADFDGDGRPDLATIEVATTNSSAAAYWIQVHLTSSGRRSIRVFAPPGGLRIEAVDVNNGNHFVDLVLTTAISKQPVAILINDGIGNFSVVEPSAFTHAFTDCSGTWIFISTVTRYEVSSLLQQRPGLHSQAGGVKTVQPQTRPLQRRNSVFAIFSFLISNAYRAPPLESLRV